MTGPGHYREAERLLCRAGNWVEGSPQRAQVVTEAQAHATLALAAATAYPAIRDYHGDEASDPREWTAATS